MEFVTIYKGNKDITFALLIMGGIMLILDMGILIEPKFAAITANFSMINWSPVIFRLQGILFAFMGYINLRSDKYYIQWDDTTLTWLLPGNRKAESVQLNDIQGVDMHLYAIQLKLANGEKTISLDNVNNEELRLIKEKLEEIKLGYKKDADTKQNRHHSRKYP